MKIKADTKTVSIENKEKLTSGALNSDSLEVELSKEYEGLTSFVTFNETEVMVVGNIVNVPTLKSGTCRIGVYAVETVDSETVLRYSPSPAIIFVSSGSYNENLHIDPPTQSEADLIYSLINKAIEEGKLKGDKGDKGEKGERGEQGVQGPQGIQGERGPQGENGKDGKDASAITNYYELENKPSINGIELIDQKTLDELNIQEKLKDEQIENINSICNKDDKTIFNTNNSNEIELRNNTEFRRGYLSSITVTLPTEIDDNFISGLVFSSGENPCVFYNVDNIKLIGSNVDDGKFNPSSNTHYNITFFWDGEYMIGNIIGVVI